MNKMGIKIIYKKINGLGYFNEKTGEIVINSTLPEKEKDIILIHEFLHLTASGLKQLGIIKRQPEHKFITNACQQLLALFVVSGKWHKKYKIKYE